MGYRAVHSLVIGTFLLAFLTALIILINLRTNTLANQIAAMIAGTTAGAILGTVAASRELKSLTKKGTYNLSIYTVLYLIGACFIGIAVIVYYLSTAPNLFQPIFIVTVWPMLPAIQAARTICYAKWEKKYRRAILYSSLLTSKIYVFPDINVPS